MVESIVMKWSAVLVSRKTTMDFHQREAVGMTITGSTKSPYDSLSCFPHFCFCIFFYLNHDGTVTWLFEDIIAIVTINVSDAVPSQFWFHQIRPTSFLAKTVPSDPAGPRTTFKCGEEETDSISMTHTHTQNQNSTNPLTTYISIKHVH